MDIPWSDNLGTTDAVRLRGRRECCHVQELLSAFYLQYPVISCVFVFTISLANRCINHQKGRLRLVQLFSPNRRDMTFRPWAMGWQIAPEGDIWRFYFSLFQIFLFLGTRNDVCRQKWHHRKRKFSGKGLQVWAPHFGGVFLLGSLGFFGFILSLLFLFWTNNYMEDFNVTCMDVQGPFLFEMNHFCHVYWTTAL